MKSFWAILFIFCAYFPVFHKAFMVIFCTFTRGKVTGVIVVQKTDI